MTPSLGMSRCAVLLAVATCARAVLPSECTANPIQISSSMVTDHAVSLDAAAYAAVNKRCWVVTCQAGQQVALVEFGTPFEAESEEMCQAAPPCSGCGGKRCCDYVQLYDVGNSDAVLGPRLCGESPFAPASIQTTATGTASVALYFADDGVKNYKGFSATVKCLSAAATLPLPNPTECAGVYHDVTDKTTNYAVTISSRTNAIMKARCYRLRCINDGSLTWQNINVGPGGSLKWATSVINGQFLQAFNPVVAPTVNSGLTAFGLVVWVSDDMTADTNFEVIVRCGNPNLCTSLPHVCSAGFQLKPTASTTTCPGTPSACDDATCCVADPLCNTHTCTSGLQLKASASSITCTGTPATCTDATCCDKLCNTHTCSAGFQLKPTPAAIVCPGTPSTCDDATCCVADPLCNTHTCTAGSQLKASASSITCTGTPCTDAKCCDKPCNTHTCSAGFQLKPTPAAIVCPGTPSTCDDATCCVADKLCNTHTCTSGSQLKASASSITCTGTPSVCTDATCCDKLCSTHTCSAGFQLKPTPAAIICPGTPSTCDDATCCVADPLCNTHTCTSGSQLKASASSITCTGTPATCTDATCCDNLCNTHTCSAGFQLKPTPAAIVCPGTPSTCDDATCCVADPLCNTHTCTAGSQLKASASSITCTGTPSVCTDVTCCDKLCSTHTCPARFQLRPAASTRTCPGTPSTCDDATCCVADPLCNTHTCTAGSQLKASASSITCTGTPSVCTDVTCCDKLCSTHTCSAGFQLKSTPPAIICPGTPSTCTDVTCCEKLCSTHTCPARFQLKPTPAGIICPGTPSTCDDATCCVADPLCNTHTCTSGLQLKASASSITCTGTPSACTDATCCEKLCSTHTCPAGFQLKPTPAAIICPGTPSTCDDATCCVADKLCNTHTCTSGSQLKASASSITCTGTPSVCTDVTCCETLCNTHTCSATFLDKPSKATLPCRSTPPVCDDATCCDTEFVCSDHTCGTGFVGNALKGNTSCGARPCPDETCCLASVPVSTFVPAEEQTTARIVGGTTSGTIVVVSAVGGATGASGLGKGGARMARNMVYLSMMDCPRSGVEEVGFVLSPTRLSFGGDDLREVRGAVVGNLALLALVVALVVGVAALRGGCFLVSLAGMPLALPVFLLEMLWMPVMQGGFAFLMYSESEAAGGAAVLTCALLFLVGTGLLTRKAKAQCTFVHNKREKGLVWFVTAAGSWESTDGPRPSVDVLASVFDGFHPAHCLYFVVQLVSMTGLAALAAWNPKTITYCGVRAGMLTILPIVWAAVLLKDLPYLRPIENAVEILITLCEFVFGVLATLAVGDQDQSLYDAAAVLGVVMTYIMMVKAAIDLCTLVYQLREEYTNHGTVCGPPVRMCCGAGCAKCASLDSSKVSFSEPMLASCTAHESLGTNESETSVVQLQAAACQTPFPPASSPSAQCYACESDGNIYML